MGIQQSVFHYASKHKEITRTVERSSPMLECRLLFKDSPSGPGFFHWTSYRCWNKRPRVPRGSEQFWLSGAPWGGGHKCVDEGRIKALFVLPTPTADRWALQTPLRRDGYLVWFYAFPRYWKQLGQYFLKQESTVEFMQCLTEHSLFFWLLPADSMNELWKAEIRHYKLLDVSHALDVTLQRYTFQHLSPGTLN